MNRITTTLAVMAIFCGMAGTLFADELDLSRRYGWYVAGSGAWTTSSDFKMDSTTDENDITIPGFELTLDPGYAIQGSVGLIYGSFRGELELGYRANKVSGVKVEGMEGTNFSEDDLKVISATANGFYDFPIFDRLGGYIGGGGGIGSVSYSSSGQANGSEFHIDADTSGLVLQFMTGLNLRITDHLNLTAGYRLWVLMSANIEVNNSGEHDASSHARSDEQMDPLVMHSLELGLRYEF